MDDYKPQIPDYDQEVLDLMRVIYVLLKENSDRYFKSSELEERFSVSGSRIRMAIHNIREAAYPIISSSKGYKWATSAEEINDCVESLWGRAKSINRAMHGLAKARKRLYPAHLGVDHVDVEEATKKIEQGIKRAKNEERSEDSK